jgi:sulfur-carrier protein
MIKILLFAHLQEKVGQESLEIDHSSLTVRELKELIGTKYELGSLEHVMVAVNEEYALDQDSIHSGDIVAFIPPVSGG